MSISYNPIGLIYSPFKSKEGVPIQPKGAKNIKGKIVLKEEFTAGLDDLQGFSHIILIYHFHKSSGYELKTTPFLDDKKHGVFATRAPKRPNAIGLSVVRINSIEKNIIYIENVDIINETPLLDIKPYIPDFDVHITDKNGWVANKIDNLKNTKSDNRFD